MIACAPFHFAKKTPAGRHPRFRQYTKRLDFHEHQNCSQGGRLLNKSNAVRFFASTEKQTARFRGRSLASHLLSEMTRCWVGVPFKYHRPPRGIVAAGPVKRAPTAGQSGQGNVQSPTTRQPPPIFSTAPAVESQNHWPQSPRIRCSARSTKPPQPFFACGLLLQDVITPRPLPGKHVYSPIIRHSAGLGQMRPRI